MKRKAPGKARGRRPRARSGPSAARDERLRTAVAASNDGFWDRDLVSGRVFHSARMNQMIGLPPVDGEAADEAWRERIHPDDLAVVGARYLAVLEGRDDRVDDTYRVRREDGAWIWVHARGQVVERDTSGRATRIAGTVTDVSALKVAEHALQASEEKYRALVESSVNGIAILRDGRVEYANAASAPILGVPDASHLVGRAVLDFIVPEQRDRARARMAEGLTGGVLPRLDFTVLRGDGTTTEVISSPSPFRDAKGPAIHAMIQDVTAERRVSRSLEKRTRELEAILASSTDWITFLDADGNVLSVNDAASEITGYTRGELERMNVREIAREDALEVQARIRECLEAGTSRFEARFRRKDGQVRDAELSVQAIEGEAGRLVAFVRDVTARKQAEKALRANEARLRMALQGSRDGLVDLDVGTGAFVGNPRMWEIVGWPEGRWKDVFDASLESVHADDLARVQGALGKVLASEASGFDEEFRVRRQDGETVWVRARFGVVERDASGRAVRAAGTLSDITELKLAHETTRAQAAMLRAIADSSDDLIFAKDANGRWTFANRALLRFVGKAEGDVLGRTDAEMLGDDERVRRIAVNDAHVTRTGESLLLEEEVARPDGLHVFLSSKSPLRDAAGRTVGVVGVAKDITDRKRVEDALRASEKALREASATVQRHLANTPLAVIEWDGDYRVTSFRGRAEEIFGWSAAEVIGKRIDEVPWLPEEAWPAVRKVMRAMDEGSRPVNVSRNRNRRKDGVLIDCEWFNSSLHGPDGKLVSVFSLVQDVTDREAAMAALGESEARFRALAESAPVGVFVGNLARETTYLSPEFERLLGVPRNEALGRGWFSFVHPEDRSVVEKALSDALTVNGRFECGHRFVQPTGKEIHVRAYGSPLLDASGELRGYLGVVVDVTEQKRVEQQLAVASRLGALGTLVTGVAHEVNNPLAAIVANHGVAVGILQEALARMRGADPATGLDASELSEAVEAIEEAEQCAQRIARMVKELALFGSPNAPRTRTRLDAIVKGAMRWLPAAVGAAASIRVESGVDAEVVVSVGQIEQVLVNLIANAARATKAGERGEIVVRAGPGRPGMVRLEVVDHGTGIPPSVLPHIFDPFFTTRPAGEGRGAGLGLAVCESLVQAHGGSIAVSSQVGRGSTFTVELPAAPER